MDTSDRLNKQRVNVSIPKGWRPMSTAPRDGTMILICETPNGEHWNVMPASYQMHLGNELMEGFWGVWTSSRLPIHMLHEDIGLAAERGLPVDYRAIACTPVCWQPFPEMEPVEKLRRRAAQIYAASSRKRNGQRKSG